MCSLNHQIMKYNRYSILTKLWDICEKYFPSIALHFRVIFTFFIIKKCYKDVEVWLKWKFPWKFEMYHRMLRQLCSIILPQERFIFLEFFRFEVFPRTLVLPCALMIRIFNTLPYKNLNFEKRFYLSPVRNLISDHVWLTNLWKTAKSLLFSIFTFVMKTEN